MSTKRQRIVGLKRERIAAIRGKRIRELELVLWKREREIPCGPTSDEEDNECWWLCFFVKISLRSSV